MAKPETCYLRVNVAGRVSVKGPISFLELERAYLDGKLGDHCELLDATDLSPAEAKQATGWQKASDFLPRPNSAVFSGPRPPESVEDLLRRLIGVQERQVFWARATAVLAFVSFVLVFVFGVTFRLK